MNKENENTVAFWKAKYDELNNQYDDFSKESRELEHELELQIEQSENQIKELSKANHTLSMNYDECKEKLNEMSINNQRQIGQLQTELAKYKQLHDSAQSYIRELEQKNENLTNSNRIALFSLEDFENKMNEAIERNALLESELQIDQMNKEKLTETVQRLRDEARDLKQEISARQLRSSSINSTPKPATTTTTANSIIPKTLKSTEQPNTNILSETNNIQQLKNIELSNDEREFKKIANETETTTNLLLNSIVNGFANRSNNENDKQNQQQQQHNHQHMTPTMRIMGLNIVGAAFNKINVNFVCFFFKFS
jgi:phage shock protein A